MNRALLRLKKKQENDKNAAAVSQSHKIMGIAQQLNNVFKPDSNSGNKTEEISYTLEKKKENNEDVKDNKENNEIKNKNVFFADAAKTNNDLVDIIDNKPFTVATKKKGKKVEFNS